MIRAILFIFSVNIVGLFSSAFAEESSVAVTIMDQVGKPVINAVITLKPIKPNNPTQTYPKAILAQRDTEFMPHVLAVPKNTEVWFPNEDKFRHHVYSFSKAKQFEIRLYSGEEEKSVIFDSPGVITIGCNIHDNMLAYVYVADAPYVLTTDKEGKVNFPAVAEGEYTVTLWHPRLNKTKSQTTSTFVLAGGVSQTKSFSLTLKRERKNRRKKY